MYLFSSNTGGAWYGANKIYDLPGLTIFNITGTAQITSIHFSC
jgi:hypothetical protein